MELEKEIEDYQSVQKIIIENPDKSIIILDAANKIVFANNTFRNSTGYDLEEIKGRSPLNLGIGENSPEEFLELVDAVGKGKTYHGKFRNVKKNGQEYYTETTVIPIYENLDQISYYIAISSSII